MKHCAECPAEISGEGKTGLCKTCAYKRLRKAPRLCACGTPLHRQNKTGRCAACAAGKGSATTDSMSVKGDACEITKSTNERVKTLADLIRVCEIDTTEWEVERWVANKWEMAAKLNDNRITTTPLYQVKAWLKRKVAVITAREEIQALIADAKKQIAPRPIVVRKASGPHALEISIPDLHIGKLAWAPETGGANYDTKIAQQVFRDALEALVARTAAFSFERIILPAGNDFFHSDTKANTTTKGTPLDTDSRYHKSFGIGRRLMTEAIERLRLIAPVTVVICPGNHDSLAAFHLGDSLECFYHQTSDVEVMNAPIPRKYVQFGRVLLMFTHGDRGKRANYPLLMATEKPDLFGATMHREVHTGHLHQLQVQEHMGVKVRVSPALCSSDAWHAENHLVGNARSAEAFVWHREEGLVASATYTVQEAH